MALKKLYLDQCVLSNLCADPTRPWQKTKLGSVILKLCEERKIEVWTTPVNVLETFLCADFDDHNHVTESEKLQLRVRIAEMLVHLTDCQRMAPAYEFSVVRNFIDILQFNAPESIRTRDYFELARTTSQQIFAGLLAMMVAIPSLDRPSTIEHLLRNKITSRLLHSRFAREPAKFVDSIISCARNFQVTTEDIWEEFDRRPIAALKAEINDNAEVITKMDKATCSKLQKNKELVAQAYSVPELGQCMESVFNRDSFLMMTFCAKNIRDNWSQIHADQQTSPPKFLLDASDEGLQNDARLLARSLATIFRNIAREQLLFARLPDAVALGELEMCLRKGEIPTAGLAFDCEHAVMLGTMDIFLTHDTRLINLAKRAAKWLVEARTWNVEVVANERQLLTVVSAEQS